MPLTSCPAEFLRRHDLPCDALHAAGVAWELLGEIHARHEAAASDLELTAQFIADRLVRVPQVHAIGWRVMDAEQLVAEVIRARLDDPARVITPDTYGHSIPDLLAIRALHLVEDEWIPIHEFVTATWELAEAATAYTRAGAPAEVRRAAEARGCVVREDPAGHRSIRYRLRLQPAREPLVVELRVRSVFEEARSEIDRRIRARRGVDGAVLAQYAATFDRLAASADDMGADALRLQSHAPDPAAERAPHPPAPRAATRGAATASCEVCGRPGSRNPLHVHRTRCARHQNSQVRVTPERG